MLPERKIWLAVAGCTIIFAVAFFFAPIFAYHQLVTIQYAYRNGVKSCYPAGGIINQTNEAEYERCLAS